MYIRTKQKKCLIYVCACVPTYKLSDYTVQIKISYSRIRVAIDPCKSDPHKAKNSLCVRARVCMYVFMNVCMCVYVCMYV